MHSRTSFFPSVVAALCLSATLALSACGSNKLDGLYVNSNGQNTVEFRDGKAFVTMVGMATRSREIPSRCMPAGWQETSYSPETATEPCRAPLES